MASRTTESAARYGCRGMNSFAVSDLPPAADMQSNLSAMEKEQLDLIDPAGMGRRVVHHPAGMRMIATWGENLRRRVSRERFVPARCDGQVPCRVRAAPDRRYRLSGRTAVPGGIESHSRSHDGVIWIDMAVTPAPPCWWTRMTSLSRDPRKRQEKEMGAGDAGTGKC
jgi:hypothetical protein